ncbi:uncharacterized protein [Palaemon carinicauda]|uniref:uncharacterized protein n=1 Tax=Palaemon carinicauda TaxID=392227 RepID=UPI0035B5C43A
MQVDWVCLSFCLMSVCGAKWIFPDRNGPSPPAAIAYTGSSNTHSHIRSDNQQDDLKFSESLISLTSVFDPEHELDFDGFPKLEKRDSFSFNPPVRRSYGYKVPTRPQTAALYGVKVPPRPALNGLPDSPPSPPAPQPSPRPEPFTLSTNAYRGPYNPDYLAQASIRDLNRVPRVIPQYNPPLILSESFIPSVAYQADEAFQPSTYFIQTEVSPSVYYGKDQTNKITKTSFQHPVITTTFKPATSPKRHATLYKEPQPYKYDILPKYTSAPVKYNTPSPRKYNTPEPYKYNTPEPYKYNTPEPYKYNTPEPYNYNTPETYKINNQEFYKYNTPEPYDSYKTYKHESSDNHKSFVSSSYDVPKSHPTESPYKHEKAKKYDYRYNVGSIYHGTAYRHQEKSDGSTVHGEYRVRLPDGRLQVVTYTADHENGYVPKVRYEGPQTLEAANIHFQPPTPTKVW